MKSEEGEFQWLYIACSLSRSVCLLGTQELVENNEYKDQNSTRETTGNSIITHCTTVESWVISKHMDQRTKMRERFTYKNSAC